jgi:hypothetical protein
MLSRSWWITVSILVVVLGLLQVLKPEPVRWERTFKSSSTQPFGTWIALHVLDSLTPSPVFMVDSASDVALHSIPQASQWWIVTPKYSGAIQEVDSLMAFVKRGGHVVIATRYFNDTTERLLGLDLYPVYSWSETEVLVHQDNSIVQRLPIGDDYVSMRFRERIDTTVNNGERRWKPLLTVASSSGDDFEEQAYDEEDEDYDGEDSSDEDEEVRTDDANQIENDLWMIAGVREYGNGTITVLSSPELLSNVAFVKDSSAAVAGIVMPLLTDISIPAAWDRYHNASIALPTIGDILSRSLAAQLAVVLVVVAGLMYLTTNMRRRQRPIPILEKVKNTTAEFTRTVADLMQTSHDPAYVMRLRVAHLRRFCANVLHVPLVNIDSSTENRLVAATGCDIQTVRDVLHLARQYGDFDGMKQQWTDAEWSAADLLRRSAILDTFYEKASR